MQVETTDPAPGARLAKLEARYRALAAQLAGVGFIARGSVVAAMTTCSSKGCHCQTDPARRHGPYWQLSRSVGGTTRTRRLSEAEAELYQGWIAERHRAEAILAELEELAAQAAAPLLSRAAGELPDPAEGPGAADFIRGK